MGKKITRTFKKIATNTLLSPITGVKALASGDIAGAAGAFLDPTGLGRKVLGLGKVKVPDGGDLGDPQDTASTQASEAARRARLARFFKGANRGGRQGFKLGTRQSGGATLGGR